MFKMGFRKVGAFIVSMIAYVGLMLTVILTKQIGAVSLESLSVQLAIGITSIGGVFMLGNYGVHKTEQNKSQTPSENANGQV